MGEPIKRRRFLRAGLRLAKGIGVVALTGGTIIVPGHFLWDKYKSRVLADANDLPTKREGLAILISHGTVFPWDELALEFSDYLTHAYVPRVELAFGQRADLVIPGATNGDFVSMLVSDQIQNIVLFGHGSWNSWKATDGSIYAGDVRAHGTLPRKNGLLVRHTCGVTKMYEGDSYILTSEDFEILDARIEELNAEFKMAGSKLRLDANLAKYDNTNMRGFGVVEGYQLTYSFEGNETFGFDGNIVHICDTIGIWEGFRKTYSRYTREELDELIAAECGADVAKKARELEEFMAKFYLDRKTTKSIEQITLGVPVYERDRIMIEEGIAWPWNWLEKPFGNRLAHLDQYRP